MVKCLMMSNDMVDMCINAMVMNDKCQLMWISRPTSETMRFDFPNSMHEWHSQHYKTSYKSIYMVCFHVNVLSMNSIYGSWHEVKDVEIIPNVILMHLCALHSFHLWYKYHAWITCLILVHIIWKLSSFGLKINKLKVCYCWGGRFLPLDQIRNKNHNMNIQIHKSLSSCLLFFTNLGKMNMQQPRHFGRKKIK
jgi:hypothetical protein